MVIEIYNIFNRFASVYAKNFLSDLQKIFFAFIPLYPSSFLSTLTLFPNSIITTILNPYSIPISPKKPLPFFLLTPYLPNPTYPLDSPPYHHQSLHHFHIPHTPHPSHSPKQRQFHPHEHLPILTP